MNREDINSARRAEKICTRGILDNSVTRCIGVHFVFDYRDVNHG